jgi:Leucine-rich repeat (LRR) protein
MDALATLTNLTTLHWVGNGTSDIGGLAPLVHLEDLVLDDNSIGDISPSAA